METTELIDEAIELRTAHEIAQTIASELKDDNETEFIFEHEGLFYYCERAVIDWREPTPLKNRTNLIRTEH